MVDSRTIRLRIISYHRLSRTQEAEKHFDTQGDKTLGRGIGCDWVLPDPSRVVSSIHATIGYHDGRFVVRDESTNGLFLNGANDPLGKENTAALSVGDVLFLGEYEVEVVAIGNGRLPEKPAQKDPAGPPAHAVIPTPGATSPSSRQDNLGLSSDAFSIPAVTPPAPRHQPDSPSLQQPFIPEQFDDHLSAFARPEEKTEAPGGAPAPLSVTPDPITTMAVDKPQNVSEPSNAVIPAPHQISDPTPPTTANRDEGAFFRAYAEALGIAREPALNNLPPAALGREAGQLTRELLEGLLQLMRTREATKSEFRAAQTRIRVGDNNPLKFSATVDDALYNLMLQSRSSYLEPVAAVRESFKDIDGHQTGLLNGMQSVFSALMTHFDPTQISQRDSPKSLMARLSSNARKAAAWDRYEALYTLLSDQHGDSLHHHFADEFVNAYDQTGTQEKHRE